MTNYKILNIIGPSYADSAKKILNSLGKTDYNKLTHEELLSVIDQYDILIVGLGLNINSEIINRANKLRIIATATTGLDHIDLNSAKNKDIKVLNLHNKNNFLDSITGTAELAFGLSINLMRFIIPSYKQVKNYEFNREKFRGHNLSKKTLGIVGLGRLGRMMSKYGQAFGMNVIAYDPYVNEFTCLDNRCKKVNFEMLLKNSDIISIHAPLNEETVNMFNKEVLKKMKKSACLINTSRGKIVNEEEIRWALEEEIISGYATDVLAGEIDFDSDLNYYPLIEYAKNNNNCIITPHIGGMTFESRENTDIFIAKEIRDYLIN